MFDQHMVFGDILVILVLRMRRRSLEQTRIAT